MFILMLRSIFILRIIISLILLILPSLLLTRTTLQLLQDKNLSVSFPPINQLWNFLSPKNSNSLIKTKTPTRFFPLLCWHPLVRIIPHHLCLVSILWYLKSIKLYNHPSKNPQNSLKAKKALPRPSLRIFQPIIFALWSVYNFKQCKENIERGTTHFFQISTRWSQILISQNHSNINLYQIMIALFQIKIAFYKSKTNFQKIKSITLIP